MEFKVTYGESEDYWLKASNQRKNDFRETERHTWFLTRQVFTYFKMVQENW